ncbi:hypothetical protein [Microbacterium indicum]|uniref:hypothetical protein n=1 Tax=Microbacterium indicum TaxID=358100 RepID=UPI0012EB1039|nr:hypothetical protein [Microbacterium indicum]
MRLVVSVAGGFLSGVLYAFLISLLAVQSLGVESGAIFDFWSNDVVEIAAPGVPILQTACIGLASAVVIVSLFGIAMGWRRSLGGGFVVGFGASVLSAAVVGVLLEYAADDGSSGPPVGPGIVGLLRKFGLESATYAVLVCVAVLAVIVLRRRGRDTERSSS